MEEFKLTQVARLEKLQNLFFWLFFTLLYTYTTFRKVTSIATPILYFNVPPYYHCLPAGVLRWLFLCTKNVFSGNGCMSPYYCPVIHHRMYILKIYIQQKYELVRHGGGSVVKAPDYRYRDPWFESRIRTFFITSYKTFFCKH